MQFMLISETKVGTSPGDFAKTIKKFQGWTPPEGVTLEALWATAEGTSYMVLNADDLGLVGEVVAQFSETHNQHVDAVCPVVVGGQAAPEGQDWNAKLLRGLKWATT